MGNRNRNLVLILLSIVLLIAFRFYFSSMYPLFWTFFMVPAILVPRWPASSIILVALTGVEYGMEYFLHDGVLEGELLLILLGGTAVNVMVFLVFASIHAQNLNSRRSSL